MTPNAPPHKCLDLRIKSLLCMLEKSLDYIRKWREGAVAAEVIVIKARTQWCAGRMGAILNIVSY